MLLAQSLSQPLVLPKNDPMVAAYGDVVRFVS
jgi:hypothetical protein